MRSRPRTARRPPPRDLAARVPADARRTGVAAAFELHHSAEEPAGAAAWELVSGPTAVVSLGQFAITATVGVSAARLHAGGPPGVGSVALLRVGTVFQRTATNPTRALAPPFTRIWANRDPRPAR